MYEAGSTGCLTERTKSKKISYSAELSTFSDNLHEAICYSQELSKKICTIFSVRSCPGRVLTVGTAHIFMTSRAIACMMEFFCPISLTHVRK